MASMTCRRDHCESADSRLALLPMPVLGYPRKRALRATRPMRP